MRSHAFPDPFELEPSTAAYVPRRATVEALAQLQAAIEHDEPVALLRGPAGIGKTLLLRLLRRRVEGRMSCVALDASHASCDALCAQALRAFGREPGASPVEELARAAGELARAGVLLLIDRAEQLTPGALQPLLDLAARCPSLQVVLAAELPAGEHPWLHAPDPRIALIEFSEPMSPRETIEYLLARLELAVAPPEARRRLGWRSWPRLIRESQGNPARLHHLARGQLGAGEGELPARLTPRAKAAQLPSGLPWRRLVLGGSALVLLIGLALLVFELRTHGPAAEPAPPSSAARQPAGPAPRPSEPASAPPVEERAPVSEPASVAEPEPPPRREPPPPAAPLPAVEAARPEPARASPPVPRPEPTSLPRTTPAPAPAARAPAPAAPVARTVVPLDAAATLGAADSLGSFPTPTPTEVSGSIPVFVNAVPAARIAIDGQDVGSTPIVGLLIPEGTRRFVASFADGRRLERSVDVEGNEVYVLFP